MNSDPFLFENTLKRVLNKPGYLLILVTTTNTLAMIQEAGLLGTLHQDTPTAKIYIDKPAKIQEIEWVGKVDPSDYQKTMLESGRLIGEGYCYAIINRLKMEEISPDSALWLKKEFIKVHLKPVIDKLNKVATVESKSAFSRFYSNSLTLAAKVLYPNLSIKSFATKEDALAWMES